MESQFAAWEKEKAAKEEARKEAERLAKEREKMEKSAKVAMDAPGPASNIAGTFRAGSAEAYKFKIEGQDKQLQAIQEQTTILAQINTNGRESLAAINKIANVRPYR